MNEQEFFNKIKRIAKATRPIKEGRYSFRV